MSSTRSSWAVLLIALIALSASIAGAQELRGVVRDSVTGTPIAGAVLVLMDSSGGALGRNITNERGEYRLAMSAFIRRMRILRIGYRPRIVELPVVSGGVMRVDVAMIAVPLLLEAMNVSDQPECPRRPDGRAALALWEQARAGLLSTIVARTAKPGVMTRLVARRVLEDEPAGVLTQSVRIDSGLSTHAFSASYTADRFIESGFRTAAGDDIYFHSPDAEVLLDDAFARAYCFHIARGGTSRPHQIGLGFAPPRLRRGRVDIEGTLWIDSLARALVGLEFRYVGLDRPQQDLNPRGSVSFRTMPNGVPLIDDWSLLLPVTREVEGPTPAARRRRVFGYTAGGHPVVLDLEVTHGVLAHGRWLDSATWQAPLQTIRGRLMSNGKPVARATVGLAATDYRASTDSSGNFAITDLLPGRYYFSVPDSQLNAVGFERTRAQRVDVTVDGVAQAEVEVPTEEDFVRAKCSDAPSQKILVIGRVFRPDTTLARYATITLRRDRRPIDSKQEPEWEAIATAETGGSPLFYSVYDGSLGSAGAFAICLERYKRQPARYRIDAALDQDSATAYFDPRSPASRIYTLALRLARPGASR